MYRILNYQVVETYLFPYLPVISIPRKANQPIVGVYVANRCLPTFKTKLNHPSNVILLDHNALEHFYGPTLSGGPAFALRLAGAADKPVTDS